MSNQAYFKSQKTRRKTKRTSDKQRVSEKTMLAKRGIMGKMGQEQITRLIMSGKWGRIGQTVMKTTTKITRLTLKWSPQGKRKGRAAWMSRLNIWRRLNLTWRRVCATELVWIYRSRQKRWRCKVVDPWPT